MIYDTSGAPVLQFGTAQGGNAISETEKVSEIVSAGLSPRAVSETEKVGVHNLR
eukprot:SAG31_NODE_111_length_24443_cov_231.743685_10_plen_54_part_00